MMLRYWNGMDDVSNWTEPMQPVLSVLEEWHKTTSCVA